MKDFEVHEIGTAKELRLSRALSNSIYLLCEQYGEGIFHESVLSPYKELIKMYKEQIEKEEYVK
jgi:hypothetical protein